MLNGIGKLVAIGIRWTVQAGVVGGIGTYGFPSRVFNGVRYDQQILGVLSQHLARFRISAIGQRVENDLTDTGSRYPVLILPR